MKTAFALLMVFGFSASYSVAGLFAQQATEHAIPYTTFLNYLLAAIASLAGVIVFFFKLFQTITKSQLDALEARATLAELHAHECNEDRNKIWRAIASAGVDIEMYKSGSDEVGHEKHAQ